MFRYVSFLDECVTEINDEVAVHPPERGGALLGPVGQPIVSRFLFDTAARTTGTTYQPSRELQARVSEIEGADPTIELKGILHSHPGAMKHPSTGDLRAFADSLRGAPWLGRFVTPIVTQTRPDSAHDVALVAGVMSVFVVERDHDRLNLHPGQPHVIPLCADLDRLAKTLSGVRGSVTLVDVEGIVSLGASITGQGFELQMIVGPSYPFTAPTILLTGDLAASSKDVRTHSMLTAGNGIPESTESLPVMWDLTVADELRLRAAVEPHLRVSTPVSKSTVGPAPRQTDRAPAVSGARDGISARLVGVTSPTLRTKRVLIVGAGSGGSATSDMLVRSGVEDFILVDPDSVGAENLSRSVFTVDDLDVPKVEALRCHLLKVNPLVRCDARHTSITSLDPSEVKELVAGSDLVIAATDDPRAQRALNHYAYSCGIPSLFAGVYAKGHAGEVVFVVPEITRCYRCVTASRHSAADSERRTDYGTGRLAGEPALGADIMHVVTASVKLALGLLEIEEDHSAARDFVFGCLAAGRNYVIVSMIPDFGFFPKVFKDTPSQYAYQSVWLSAVGDPACPVCGIERSDPLSIPLRPSPRVTDIQPVEPLPESANLTKSRSRRKLRK